MAHIQYVDDLVREYMLFRGFSSSLKSFDSDLKSDKDKSFRVDKIIDQITHTLHTQDLNTLREIWNHLDTNLFNKLEHSYSAIVKKLEHSTFKLYLVLCASKPEKISEFFTKLAPELVNQPEWKEWFFFPFCKNHEEHPTFSVCFTKQWQDTLLISLHNFLATIFQCMPQPTLTRAETEASLIKKLQEENSILRNRIQTIGIQIQGSTNQSRFNEQNTSGTADSTGSINSRQLKITKTSVQNINDISPFDIPPPNHIVDDFYIIAQETLHTGMIAESQAKSLKALIRNIGSGSSPIMGRKELIDKKRQKDSFNIK